MFNAISNTHSNLFEVENIINMFICELSEVVRWLDEWRVVSFFKASKFFKIGEAIKLLNAFNQQLSEEK